MKNQKITSAVFSIIFVSAIITLFNMKQESKDYQVIQGKKSEIENIEKNNNSPFSKDKQNKESPNIFPVDKIDSNALQSANKWIDLKNNHLVTINWTEPVIENSLDILRDNRVLDSTVDYIYGHMTKSLESEYYADSHIPLDGGVLTKDGIKKWEMGSSTVLELTKSLKDHIQDSLLSNLTFKKLGQVSSNIFKDSTVYHFTVGCFSIEGSENPYCDTSYHIVLITPDNEFIRLTNYSDYDGDMDLLRFFKSSEEKISNYYPPPIIAIKDSNIPLVHVSNTRGPIDRSNEKLELEYTDPISGTNLYTDNSFGYGQNSCCFSVNKDGTRSIYQFDFDGIALQSTDQSIISKSPSLSTGILNFTYRNGQKNQQSFTHNSMHACNGELPFYEKRINATILNEHPSQFFDLGVMKNGTKVYGLKNESVLMSDLYINRNPQDEYSLKWNTPLEEFLNSVPALYIEDPLGGLIQFVNTKHPFRMECGGKTAFRYPVW